MNRLTKDELLRAAEPYHGNYWALLPPQYRHDGLDPDTFNMRVAALRGEHALLGTTPDHPSEAAVIAAFMGMAAEVNARTDGQEFLDAVIAEIARRTARSTRRYRTRPPPMASRAVH